MSGLAIKDVRFNGATLRAAQDAENIIWVGVVWVCQGLGLSEGQMKNERKKIQTDEVLSQGTKFHPLGSGNSDSEVLCLKLDFLPLWLAKIHVTPKMRRDNPQLADKLNTYQLKAKDVLASAFLNKNALTPQGDYIKQITKLQIAFEEMYLENQKMYKDMSALANIMLDWKESFEKNTSVKSTLPDANMYSSWKETMYRKMDRICANTTKFGKRSDVMRWIYKYMTKNYGVVWDQEAREYKERNQTAMMPSTIDVVMDKTIIKSIFESVLADMEYECCHKNALNVEGSVENWTDQIIAPLIERYNDHSNAGMTTYRRVYKKMDADNKICWKNLTTRYINEHGKKPSRKDMIETRPSLRKNSKVRLRNLWKKYRRFDIMDEYKVIGKFLSSSKITGDMVKMVVVQDARGACVMPEDEWKWVYGRQHRDRWKKNDSAA